MVKKFLALLSLVSLMGCSAMSLQCGIDGDSSYVNLNTTPKVLSQSARTLAQLCGFAYEVNDNGSQTENVATQIAP